MPNVPIINRNQVRLTGQKLGEGFQAEIQKGLYRGVEVAVKSRKVTNNANDVLREIYLHSLVTGHENIIKIYAVYVTEDCYNIVLEFFKAKTLKEIILGSPIKNRISVRNKNKIARQITGALVYIHSKEIIHKDMKLSNVMMNDNFEAKIIDFGLARSRHFADNIRSRHNFVQGDPRYQAPEVNILNDPIPANDVWSTGCTLKELYSEKVCWGKHSATNALMGAIQGFTTFQGPPSLRNVPNFLHNILLRCFSYEPRDRPTMHQLWSTIETEVQRSG